MERPTAEAVGRGAGYVAAANVITSLIAFAFYTAAARILGPRGMGEVTMLFLVIGLYGAVGLLGANAAAARFAAYHSGSGSAGRAASAIVRSMELAAAGSLASFAALAAASPWISAALGIPEGLVLLGLAAGLASNAGSALSGALQGLAMFGDISAQSVMASALSRIPAIALAIPLGPVGVAVAWALGPAAGALYAALRLRRRLGPRVRARDADPVSLREILVFSAPLYALSIISFLQGWLGISFLYAVSRSLEVTGTYYVASASAGILGIIYGALSTALLPAMSFRFGEAGHRGVADALRSAEGIVVYVTLTASLAAAAASRPLLELFYGPAYAAYAPEFSVLAGAAVVGALGSLYGTSLQSMGMTREWLVAGAASVGVLFGSLAALAPVVGAIGVAVAAVVSSATSLAMSYWYVRRRAGHAIALHPRKLAFAASVGVVVAMAQATAGWAHLHTVGSVAVDAIAFVAAFAVLSRAMDPLEPWERAALLGAIPAALRPLAGALVGSGARGRGRWRKAK
ncbi:MAG: lipopolysaccharide biosynthesis protein [Conexivisphaera sp.]